MSLDVLLNSDPAVDLLNPDPLGSGHRSPHPYPGSRSDGHNRTNIMLWTAGNQRQSVITRDFISFVITHH